MRKDRLIAIGNLAFIEATVITLIPFITHLKIPFGFSVEYQFPPSLHPLFYLVMFLSVLLIAFVRSLLFTKISKRVVRFLLCFAGSIIGGVLACSGFASDYPGPWDLRSFFYVDIIITIFLLLSSIIFTLLWSANFRTSGFPSPGKRIWRISLILALVSMCVVGIKIREAKLLEEAFKQARFGSEEQQAQLLLHSPFPVIRKLAAEELAKHGKQSLQPLLIAARDRDQNVRGKIADILGALGDPAAIDTLTTLSRDASSYVGQEAIVSLGKIKDERAVNALLAALKTNKGDLRDRAIDSLGNIGNPLAIPILFDLLKSEMSKLGKSGDYWMDRFPHEQTRNAIIGALRQVGLPAVKTLVASLQDNAPSARKSAAYALNEIGDKASLSILAGMRNDSEPQVRRIATEAQGKLDGRPGTKNLLLSAQDKDADVRSAAIDELSKTDTKDVGALITYLDDKAPKVRESAARALGNTRDMCAVKPLITLLVDEDYDVRYAAAFSLGRLKNPLAAQALCAALKDSDAGIRAQAAESLLLQQDRQTLSPLLETLGDSDYTVREKSIEALQTIVLPRDIPLFASLLKSRNSEVACGALEVLMYVPGGNIVPLIEEALSSRNRRLRRLTAMRLVGFAGSLHKELGSFELLMKCLKFGDDFFTRREAAKLLGELKDPRAVKPLIAIARTRGREWNDTCYYAMKALAGIDTPEAWDFLVLALKKKTYPLTVAAISALGKEKKKEPEIAALLLEAVKARNRYVRLSAIRALGYKGNARAVEPLIAVLHDKTVRDEAIWTLGEIGDERAFEALKALLSDATNSHPMGMTISDRAAIALGQLKHRRATEILLSAVGNERCLYRKGAISGLVYTGDPRSLPVLLKALESFDKEIRCTTIRAMGAMRNTRVVVPLIKLLNDDDSGVRASAAGALGKLKDRRATFPLVEYVRKYFHTYDECAYALEALSLIGDKRAVQPLRELLKERKDLLEKPEEIDPQMRKLMGILVKLDDRQMVVPLIALLERRETHNNWTVRQQAAELLCSIGDSRAVPALISSLMDEAWSVREKSLQALRRITGHDFGFEQEKWQTWWNSRKH